MSGRRRAHLWRVGPVRVHPLAFLMLAAPVAGGVGLIEVDPGTWTGS